MKVLLITVRDGVMSNSLVEKKDLTESQRAFLRRAKKVQPRP